MEMENNIFQMEIFLKANSLMASLMVKAVKSMQMITFIKVSGRMDTLMEKEYFLKIQENSILDNGKEE